MSLNPDYLYRMAKLIQEERIREAEVMRRFRRARKGQETPPRPAPSATTPDTEPSRQQIAS